MSPLDPKFSTLLAKGVLQRAGSMPEREVVSALNVCTTMSAKAKLMQNKGMTKDVDPLTEIRQWFQSSVLVESTEVGDTEEQDDGTPTFMEVDDAQHPSHEPQRDA